jgi:ATP-dependent RNA helicase DeaD
VAAAAVKLAHEALAGTSADEDEVQIPAYEGFARPEPRAPRARSERAHSDRGRGDRPAGTDQRRAARGSSEGAAGAVADAGAMVRIYVGAGRRLGMRPADLVGAIANEADVNPRSIGQIEIADGFSLVELPESDADRVVAALRGTSLRGRKVVVRRDAGRRPR